MHEFQIPPPVNSNDFENLICDMFNEMHSTISFKRFGKNGHAQKGIDIISLEKEVIIQCKAKDLTRKAIMLKKELFSDIDQTINSILIEKLKIEFSSLYIVTTFSEHTDFDEYCTTIKQDRNLDFNLIFWGWETIQRKLAMLPNTLFSHYPNFNFSQPSTEKIVVSKLEMKRRIERDFADWLNYSFKNRTRNSEMIIHSIDDTKYPEHEKNKEGRYQWFRAEIESKSHKGIEFVTGIEYIYVDKDFSWIDSLPNDSNDYTKVKAAKISIVAYEDIVEYDLRGDEHYMFPHFFCKFRHNGTPFIEEYYKPLDNKEMPYYFDNTTKKHFS
jgi:hypothetical protein